MRKIALTIFGALLISGSSGCCILASNLTQSSRAELAAFTRPNTGHTALSTNRLPITHSLALYIPL